MPSENKQDKPAEQERGYVNNPFGLMTTTGEAEVIKAADVARAEKEEPR